MSSRYRSGWVPEGPGDEDITTSDTSTPTQNRVIAGPITRARACQLNQQVSSLLSSCSSYLDCGDTCTLLLIRIMVKTEREKSRPKGRRTRAGWIQTAEKHQLVMDATVAYEVGLGRLSTPWNEGEVNFHMDSDSCPYVLCAGRNCQIIDRMSICPTCCATLFGPMGRVSSGAP
jgi:hypothetical protein